MDYIEMQNEEFIEECVEENEAIEEAGIVHKDSQDNPLQRAPEKKKRERSEKQIESLKKAQAARARNIAEKKLKKSVPTIKETITTAPDVVQRVTQSKPLVATPQSHVPNKKKKRRQRIIIQNDDSSSSEEDVIVIQNKHKKKKKILKKPIVVESSSDSEEDDNDHNNFVQENIKNNYQTSFRFI